ncbi:MULTISPECIES: BamA/TamA family outer membrane protein [Prochlorococcus]|uniref:BamA/TamA family outer membrane protein n=1 Tax=Prochlorococcus sp. MIT 0601 TaxID=1499498 RepID=UPI002FBE8829
MTVPLFASYVRSDSLRNLANPKNSNLDLKKLEIAESKKVFETEAETSSDPLVLISEIVIEGLEGHPEQKRLEYAAYDAMSIRPGSKVTRAEVKNDLNAIYATGWFSGVGIDPINSPLGVQILVKVQPNPSLKQVEIKPKNTRLNQEVIDSIFKFDYGKTLNYNVLQLRMKKLKDWYLEEGYSLARVTGPNRVTSEGVVQLNVIEGTVEGVKIQFIDQEGNTVRENGKPVKGKTRKWVIERELATRRGSIFNRKVLESDIKRLYATSLFSDLKVTLNPVAGEPGKVIVVLGISEQRTGSLTGGLGYSGAQGFFGSIGLQESNLLGRAWKSDWNFTYGEYGALIKLSLTDPWIKGDKYKTSFRTSVFISREVPQEFRSDEGGKFEGVTDYSQASGSAGSATVYDIGTAHGGGVGGPFASISAAEASNANLSWFDYAGDSIILQKTGGGFSFTRPFNGGDPFKKAEWSALIGMNFQKVQPIDYSSQERPYGVASKKYSEGTATNDDVICVAYNCAQENTLVSVRTAVNRNKLNNARNPTDGDFLSVSSEQFVSVGENSPTFNRAKASYSYFIPINWVKLHKGCRPKSGEEYNCPQALGFQLKGGSILGDLPPYEAFCLGGSKSIRGWSSCDLGVSRSYGEASAEYRFPIWRMVSGNLFLDAGTDFDTQDNVPGKPGVLLDKQGSGFSTGAGLSFNTPVGPLRVEIASKDFGDDWRYNLGFGWKF